METRNEKYCYKYAHGYLNFSKDYLCCTNTGNWSEVRRLTESSASSRRHQFRRQIWIGSFLIATALLVLYFTLHILERNNGGPVVLLEAGVFAYGVYSYFQRELGAAFKIPAHKLLQLEVEGPVLNITYLNFENEKRTQRIESLEGRGFYMLAYIFQDKTHGLLVLENPENM